MSFLDRLRALLGLGGRDAPQTAPAPAMTPTGPAVYEAPDDGTEGTAAKQEALEKGFAVRDAFWSSVGTRESDVLGNLISPSFMGGPHWPTTRQAYRIVRRPASIILATDGMSDPFDRGELDRNGFEMELFIETADIEPEFAGAPGDVSRLKESWAFLVLQNIGQTVAGAGGIVDRLERYGTLSIDVPGVGASPEMVRQLPVGFLTEEGSLGVLLGNPAPDFDPVIPDMPLSPVRMVPIVLLRADELAFIVEGGREARDDVTARIAALPHGHRSSLTRPSVVAAAA